MSQTSKLVTRPKGMIKAFALVLLGILSINIVQGAGTKLEDKIDAKVLNMLSVSTEYVVDDILELLNSFASSIQNQLDNLDENLERELASLEKLIHQKGDQVLNRTPHCHHLDLEEEFRQSELERISSFVNWITQRIERNNELIRKLYDERCITHMMYIDFIQNSKYFLRMLQVLRGAVQSFSFVQVAYLGDMLDDLMNDVSVSDEQAVKNVFAEVKKIKELTEEARREDEREALNKYGSSYLQTNERSQETKDFDYSIQNNIDDVGLDNIDEFHAKMQALGNRGAEPAKKFNFDKPILKQKILDIVNELQTIIENNMSQRLNDEVESNIAAADFANFLMHENSDLSTHTALYNKPIYEAEEKLNAIKGKAEKCWAEVNKVNEYVELLKRKKQLYSTNRNAFKNKLLREMDLFNEIWGIYAKGLEGVSDGLKERIDDGLANGHFEGTAHYDKRSLHAAYADHADDLHSKVEAQAHEIVKSAAASEDGEEEDTY